MIDKPDVRPCSHKLGLLPLVCLALSGCIGEERLFKEKQILTGDYFLTQGTDGYNERYLMLENKEAGLPGRISQIGWNQNYILFTDVDWPQLWHVINVQTKEEFTVTEAERVQSKQLGSITVMASEAAWCGYVGCRTYR